MPWLATFPYILFPTLSHAHTTTFRRSRLLSCDISHFGTVSRLHVITFPRLHVCSLSYSHVSSFPRSTRSTFLLFHVPHSLFPLSPQSHVVVTFPHPHVPLALAQFAFPDLSLPHSRGSSVLNFPTYPRYSPSTLVHLQVSASFQHLRHAVGRRLLCRCERLSTGRGMRW